MLVVLLGATGCWVGWSRGPVAAGGGLLVPADADVEMGWQVELEKTIRLIEVSSPLRLSGGSSRVRGTDEDLDRVGLSLWFQMREWSGPAGEATLLYDIVLMAGVGGGLVWSQGEEDGAPIVGVRVHFLRLGKCKHWDMVVAYEWMPVDVNVSGRDISDAGGFSAAARFTW
jgi:hypothetical protein